MALLAIDTPDASSPSGPLVDGTMRHRLASELNAAILAAQYQDQGAYSRSFAVDTCALCRVMCYFSLVRMITLIRTLTENTDFKCKNLLSLFTTAPLAAIRTHAMTEPRLPQLLKLLLFSQSQLEEKCVFPKMNLAGNLSA